MVLGGGTSGEDAYRFHPKNSFNDYMPTVHDNKWGYADAQDKIIIPCIYDYTSIFERDVARVK